MLLLLLSAEVRYSPHVLKYYIPPKILLRGGLLFCFCWIFCAYYGIINKYFLLRMSYIGA